MGDYRDRAIFDAHRRGVTEAQLAREHEVSRQRIHQIVRAERARLRTRETEIEAFQLTALAGRYALGDLLLERRVLDARIRLVIAAVRTAEEELASRRIDELLGV